MRTLINRFGVPLSVGIIVLALIMAFLFRQSSTTYPPGDPSLAWYIDEETGEESVLPSAENIPPLLGKDGKKTLVQAFKFAGDDEKTANTYYLVKYSDSVRNELAKFTGEEMERLNMLHLGQLVRSLEPNSPWVTLRDPRATDIISVPDHSSGPRRQVFPPGKR